MIGGNSYKATIDTRSTANFVSEEMVDNIAALGRITRTDGKLGWQAEDAVKLMRSSRWRSNSTMSMLT